MISYQQRKKQNDHMIKKLECVRTVHTKKVTNKFNYKHLATHPNIDIGAKVTLKRHGKEINIQSNTTDKFTNILKRIVQL